MMAIDLYPHRGGRNVRRAHRLETINWARALILGVHVLFVVVAILLNK